MADDKQNYQNISVTDNDNAEVKITGEITNEKLQKSREKALENLRQSAEVDGFRKGNAPDDVLEKKYGDMHILQQAAELALSDEYPTILRDHQIQAIGQPRVSITKLAPDDALGFEIITARMPEVKIPDYKKTAKEALKNQSDNEEDQLQKIEASDKEVDDTILQVRRNVAQQRQQQSGIETSNPDDALPDLTDEFVQSLGDFSDVEDFKAKIRENIKEQKRQQNQEKKRVAVMEALIEGSDITLPDIVIEGELEKMLGQLKEDVSKAGLNFEDYLKQVGKSEEDLRKEWRPQAIKKAKSQLILNKIAVEEKMSPEQDEVNRHVEQIITQYPNANRDQAKVFVETQLLNEKVLAMLENQAETQSAKKTDSSKKKSGKKKKE